MSCARSSNGPSSSARGRADRAVVDCRCCDRGTQRLGVFAAGRTSTLTLRLIFAKLKRMTTDLPASPPPSADADACLAAARELGVPNDYGRTRSLRRVREPARLRFIGEDIRARPQWLAPRAGSAWARLRGAAEDEGVQLQVVSAFRSIEYQLGILRRKLERGQSVEQILAVSAAPGYSDTIRDGRST